MNIRPKPTLILPPELKADVDEARRLRAERHNTFVTKVFNEVIETFPEAIDAFVFLESLTAGLTQIYIGSDPEAQREYLGALLQSIMARLATIRSPTTIPPGPSSPIN